MFFWAHLIYALVVLIHGAVGSLSGPGTREEFDLLPRAKKNKVRAVPYVQIVFMLIFPIMNGIIRNAFGQKFVFELMTACFFSLAIFQSCTLEGSRFKKPWLLYAAYFIYTLIKNIIVLDGFFITLIAQLQATATLVFVFFYTAFLSAGTNPKSRAEQERDRADLEKYQEERRQREAQARYEEEQKRLREEQEARTHEAYERIVLGKKTRSSYSGSSNDSFSSRFGEYVDDYVEDRYNRGKLGAGSATACCDNCRYYSGGLCTNSNSHSHNQTIFDPSRSSCGWHK